MTGSTVRTGRSRAADLEDSIRSRLSARSSTIDQARATRERATKLLDTLREE